jgi:competence CoiA-like predicted nuclease
MATGWAQRYAVIDGPHGQALVVAPSERDVARQIRGSHTFHCTTRAGGCGQSLILRAGDVNVPHFSHVSGDRHCDAEADRWTHLHVQTLLRAWLTSTGRDVSIEHAIHGGRLDVAVHTAEGLIAIEVQRAVFDRAAWQQRTATYRAATRGPSWL